MPATTPRLSLPYPIPDDTVDVPRDIKALADALDPITTRPPLVTTLPGAPADGDEIYFDAGQGIKWHLRYDAALPGTSKWNMLGGAPLVIESWGDLTLAPSVMVNDPDVIITAPAAGLYLTGVMATSYQTDVTSFQAWTYVNGAQSSTFFAATWVQQALAEAVVFGQWQLVLAAGDLVSPAYWQNSGATGTTRKRTLTLLPRFIG